MKPGRELDMLVAEKVMGCKVLRATDEGLSQREYERRRRWENARCGCAGSMHNDSDDEGCYEWLKEYSTDIAAAFEVVEKINSSKNKWLLNSLRCDPNDGKWQFGDIDRDGSIWPDDKYDSAPHAICLAALKAVGVEV